MKLSTIAVLTATVLVGAVSAQERLFRAEDRAARNSVCRDLEDVLSRKAGLPTTISLAAIAGTRLPDGSAADRDLQRALAVALAGTEDRRARQRLRSDLGDLVAVLSFEPMMEAELPEGFPGFRSVGEIELREYPKYRLARTEMKRGSMGAFWPLFQHIQSNDIAMTTPVQMDWDQSSTGRPVNMAFLYSSLDIEPESTAKGIEVTEIPAQTVLSIGAIGSDRRDRVETLGARLEAFLAAPACPLEACGPMRTMGYNSPSVSGDRRYFEVQIPVRSRAF